MGVVLGVFIFIGIALACMKQDASGPEDVRPSGVDEKVQRGGNCLVIVLSILVLILFTIVSAAG